MTPGFNPVMLLAKLPIPDPSLVLLSFVVGFAVVLQHTPLAVTSAPPSAVMVPPEVAEDSVFDEISIVVRLATAVRVVKVMSLPYPVPAEFVA